MYWCGGGDVGGGGRAAGKGWWVGLEVVLWGLVVVWGGGLGGVGGNLPQNTVDLAHMCTH